MSIIPALLLALCPLARAADYYVDAQAAGGGNGSLASPWNSVAQVNAHGAFAAGDKILFKRGTVFTGGSGLVVNGNGAAGNPIIYGTYSGSGVYPGTGPKPQINDTTGSGVFMSNRSYIQVQDLSFNRNGALGVQINSGNFITILRVDVTDNGTNAAINASFGGNILIDGCTVTNGKNGGIQFKGTLTDRVHDSTIQNCVVHGTISNDGIVLHNGATFDDQVGANIIIRNNVSHDCQEQGYDITSGTNVLLENNVSYDNGEGAITIGHAASNVTVRYHSSTNEPTVDTSTTLTMSGPNVTIEYSTFIGSATNSQPLVNVSAGSAGQQPDNVTLRNNVFAWNWTGGGTILQVADHWSGVQLANENLTIKNNIFTSRTGASPTIRFSSANRPLTYATYVIRNNLYDDAPTMVWNNQGTVYSTFAAYKAAFNPSGSWNEKSGDPLFVNAGTGDFHLASTSSPAYNAGTSTLFNNEPAMPSLDPDGVSIPQGGTRDIGAFEFPAGGSTPAAPTSLTATAASSSTINLNWTDNSANETGFEVDRALNSAFSSGLVTNAYTTGANPSMPVTAGGLSASTAYYFRARATNANGDSANSNTATATTQAGGSGAFQMSGNQVVMEAEHATTRTSSTGGTVYSWTDVTESGASGGAGDNAVQSLPNATDAVVDPGTGSSRADYEINVPAGSAANFFVHLRGRGPTASDNSVWVSIDGDTTTYRQINLPASSTLGNWVVSGQTLAIPSGSHTVTLWMRENGAVVDKIVVKDNNTLPTGTGPAESSQGGSNSVPSITTTTLPGGTQNVAYSQTLAATGGDGALVWSLDSGTLPTGVSLSSGGVISGTPTNAGAFNFTVRVADSDGNTGPTDEDTQALSLTIIANTAPSITTTTLPNGTQNVAYSQTLAATGGDGALVWSLDSGTLPNGLSLSSAGVISGTPTVAGPFNFTVRVADSDAVTGASDEDTQALSITVSNGAFQMSGNQVVMEAEHATTRTSSTGGTVYSWTDVTESGASGGGSNNAVQSLPNATAASVVPGTGSCRADYQINVPAGSAANFYFHLRGRGATTADESVWVSIDGNTTTYRQINLPVSGSLGNWVVSGQTLAIPSGTHTVTLWMRENGAVVDKIVVKDNTTLPTGTGPTESPH